MQSPEISMTGSFTLLTRLMAARVVVWRDTRAGLAIVIRQAFALLGVSTATVVIVLLLQPQVRPTLRDAFGQFQAALFGAPVQSAVAAVPVESLTKLSALPLSSPVEPSKLDLTFDPPITHIDAAKLPRNQRAAAEFLARKYRLAPDAIAVVVSESYRRANELQIDPLLILAVMSIESSMNPFAQSAVGAQGLMQVLTRVHTERFAEFGGPHAALHPVANVRVGAEILKELIGRYGSVEAGLKAYVGAALHDDDSGYANRVLLERARLEAAVTGKRLQIPSPAPQAVLQSRPTVDAVADKPAEAVKTSAVSARPAADSIDTLRAPARLSSLDTKELAVSKADYAAF